MIKKIFFRYPTYYAGKGDISKKWFVSWYEWNEETLELDRHREYGTINQLPVDYRQAEADRMIRAVTKRLEEKYKSPEHQIKTLAEQILDIASSKKMLRKKSGETYKVFSDALVSWLIRNNIHKMMAGEFTVRHAYEYMDHIANKGVTATTWNNYRDFTKTYFIELKARKIIKENPFAEIRKLPAQAKTHVAFSVKQQIKIRNYLQKHQPRLLLFVSFMYYCFIRPGNELCHLKIKNIDWKEKKIQIISGYAKNNRPAWVVIPDEFVELLESYGLQNEDPELFVFGNNLTPSRYAADFDTPGKLHRSILNHLNIPKDCTLYSWKHTGAIRSVQAGCNLKDLQLQLRHHSLDEVNTYLRGLGLEASTDLRGKFPKM